MMEKFHACFDDARQLLYFQTPSNEAERWEALFDDPDATRVRFSSYLDEEKLGISKQFLVPRQLAQHGLEDKNVRFDDASLKTLEPAVGRWPWPRDAHSVLLSYLERAGARLVVFDLLFLQRTQRVCDDNRFKLIHAQCFSTQIQYGMKHVFRVFHGVK